MGIALDVGTPEFRLGERWKRISVDRQVVTALGGIGAVFRMSFASPLEQQEIVAERLTRHGRAKAPNSPGRFGRGRRCDDRWRTGSFF